VQLIDKFLTTVGEDVFASIVWYAAPTGIRTIVGCIQLACLGENQIVGVAKARRINLYWTTGNKLGLIFRVIATERIIFINRTYRYLLQPSQIRVSQLRVLSLTIRKNYSKADQG